MKKTFLIVLALISCYFKGYTQAMFLNYSGYHVAFVDDFNYYDPSSPTPTQAFKTNPAFTDSWKLVPNDDNSGDYPCIGWGTEVYSPNMVTIPMQGIVRLKETAATPPAQCSTTKRALINHVSGMLNLTLKRKNSSEQDSGIISVGIIEASIKIPSWQGSADHSAWPAFWIPWGENSVTNQVVGAYNEIDILDNHDGSTNAVWNKVYFSYPTSPSRTGKTELVAPTPYLDGTFHLFSCLWTPSRISFYVDKKLTNVIDYSNGQNFPDFQSLYISLETHENTNSGLEMDVDWVKYWVKDCNESDFVLTPATINSPQITSVMTYPYLPPDFSKNVQFNMLKHKNIYINVPYSSTTNIVRTKPIETATVLEAESITILPDFFADESILQTKVITVAETAGGTHLTYTIPKNGYLDIRAIKCGVDNKAWFKNSDGKSVTGKTSLVENNLNNFSVKPNNTSPFRTDITIHPNPTTGQLNITMPAQGDYEIKITNMLGVVVYQGKLKDERQKQIQLENNLPSGNYTVQITGKEVNHIEKITLTR